MNNLLIMCEGGKGKFVIEERGVHHLNLMVKASATNVGAK